MKYHIEVTSLWPYMSQKDVRVVECSRIYDAIMIGNDMAVEELNRGADAILDIHIMPDESWQANDWNAGHHFSYDNMKMAFRMYK